MGNSVEDLEAFMRIVSTQSPWKYDHAAIHAPWTATNLQTSPRHLRIGVLPEDTEYTIHPPVRRALNEACALLRDAGHTLIPLAEDPTRSIGLGARLAFYSYGIGAPSHQEFMAKLGEPLVMSIGRGVHPFAHHPPLATATDDLGEKLHKFAIARDQYSDSWRRTWVQHDLDVVLAPGAQSTAVPHDQYGVPAYTCAWNVPDFPACIIPFSTASKERDPDAVFATAAFDPDCESRLYNPSVPAISKD
jgi:amidase